MDVRTVVYRALALALLAKGLIAVVGAANGWLYANVDWAPYTVFVGMNGWMAVCACVCYFAPHRSVGLWLSAAFASASWLVASALNGPDPHLTEQLLRALLVLGAAGGTWWLVPHRVEYHQPVRGTITLMGAAARAPRSQVA